MALKEQEFEERLVADRDQRQSATETEKLKALKLEASKWKQAMKEAEKRVALELNQAKEQGREEREAELMLELNEAKQRCNVAAGTTTATCYLLLPHTTHTTHPIAPSPRPTIELSPKHPIDLSCTFY